MSTAHVIDKIFDNTATFNLWADPRAAQAPLDHFQHVTLIGENAAVSDPIRPAFVARLQTTGETPEARWVAALASHPGHQRRDRRPSGRTR